MTFTIPTVWRKPRNNVSDCFFCLISITGVKAKSICTVQYPNLPYAMRPVPHGAESPVPNPPTNMTLSDSKSSDADIGQANNSKVSDPTFAEVCSSNEPHPLTEGDLNDNVRDLNLSKKQAELIGSRLKGWNLLCRTLKYVFTMGAMKNSRICSPRKMVSCFAMMFVPLWRFLAMDITQISGACSLIRQK